MPMPRPSDEAKEMFRGIVPQGPGVTLKPMFGNIAAFVHGNMFAGLFGPAVGVRLDDAGRAELEGIDGSGPFGPAERPMGGYTSLPEAWRGTPDVAAQWVERALAHVSAMPPKVKKPTARRK